MDLTKNIIYRGFTLNDEDITDNIVPGRGIGAGISGCVVDSVDWNDLDVVQFMEKRALEDGMDVGDVYRGARRLRMAGTIYATDRAELYDQWMAFRAALDPVLAQADEPADKGYRPLYFSIPTNNLASDGTGFPSGYIDMRLLALPRGNSAMLQRDSQGGDDTDALAIPWQATFISRDPRLMGEEPQDYDLSAGGTVTGTLINRGNHYGVLNMVMPIDDASGTIVVQAGTSIFTLTIPADASNHDRIVRLKGDDKIITIEDSVTSVEVTAMNAISFSGDNTWPQVQPGSSDFSVVFTGVTPDTGAHMYFWESYA